MTWTDLTDGVEDRAVREWLEQLAALGDTAAPEPGHELAALIAGDRVVSIDSAGSRARRRIGAAGLAAAVLLTGGVGAAAAEVLPRPAQEFVAGLVRTLTPFEVPEPGVAVPEEGREVGPVDRAEKPAPHGRAARDSRDPSVVGSVPSDGGSGAEAPGAQTPTTTAATDGPVPEVEDGARGGGVEPAPVLPQQSESDDDADHGRTARIRSTSR